MKTKVELANLSEMTIKEFQSDAQREFKRLAAYGQATNILVLTEYTFKCGNVGAIVIPGEFTSEIQKFYKEQKVSRAKEKDFGYGQCIVQDNKVYIDLQEGPAKVSDLEKGLKKTKINFETIISKNSGLPTTNTIKEDSKPEKAAKANVAEPTIHKTNAEEVLILKQLDHIKALFQKVKEILPKIVAGKNTAEDMQVFARLQQNIQQWFGLFTSATPEVQGKLKEQATKLKEQYSKIAALVQKTK